jgi:DNA-binding transcriptional regulator/RsmH inhibitor MraZ
MKRKIIWRCQTPLTAVLLSTRPKRAAKFLEKMDQIDLANEEEQLALMELSAMAQSFSYDSQGRISLDDKLLEYAGIKGKEVVLLGNFSTFSIWSTDNYEKSISGDVQEQSQKLKTSLPKLGGI